MNDETTVAVPPATPDWRGPVVSAEPPANIRYVRDVSGSIADRLEGPCEWCHKPEGSIWRWRHNGNSDCWLDIDGIGPWEGWV